MDFEENKHEYTNPDIFDEENTKVKFLNPFFEALGWNVRNEGLSARFREVVFEDSIKVGGKTKAPDYSFRIGGERIFFVEAKKPSQDISSNLEHAFQVRRYGWSAKLPLCILTDFEELAIYDTTIKPDKNQGASIGRIKYYKYTEYIDKWDEIYNIFSKEAVLNGKFDNYANNIKHDKKGTSEIDDEFLKEIEQWRLLLARNIALRNEDLSIEELNYAVQLTIDRIIFLRIAEDRGIERYGQLLKLREKENIYKEFGKICKVADEKYNSGLFHFNPYDKEDFTTDNYTLDLTIDNNVFKEIFKNLYYPNSPYEFSLISTEILGKIYEQFLGKVIRLTPGHQAKVEDKPEVKKAGGVYYTPQYIVDYIVENTLGEKIRDKTPNQISKIRVIDPACGSGSFLIRAYQYLLDYHLDYYSNLEKPPKDTIYMGKDGVTRLTIREKKRILKNNIYGVDLDTLAVEVTKLSLLLKVLEDQNKDQLESQQKLFHERALPNLSSNIKNGNSLIATDILKEQELTIDELKEIKPFDWEKEYSSVFQEGGFDVVIGNPPYFNIDTWGTNSKRKDYIKKNYKEVWNDKTDILFYFIKKASDLTSDKLGYIISNSFLFADKADKLKNYILENIPIYKIVNFEKYQVFTEASITTCIILGSKIKNKNTLALGLSEDNYSINNLIKILTDKNNYFNIIFNENDVFPVKTNEIMKLNEKIDANKPKIGELIHIGKGMETGRNNIYSFKEYPEEFPTEFIKRRINTKNCGAYYLGKENCDYVLYVEDYDNFNDLPKTIQEYLKKHRAELKNRADVKRRNRSWWNFTFPLHKEYYKYPKIVTNYRNKKNEFALDIENEYIGFTNTTVLFDTNKKYNIKYILALLNSNVLSFRYQSIGKQTGNGSYEYFENGIRKLPIPEVSLDEQQPFVELADKMMNIKKQYYSANTPTERKLLQQQLNFLDQEINQLVYELYGLTDEEIEVVESIL